MLYGWPVKSPFHLGGGRGSDDVLLSFDWLMSLTNLTSDWLMIFLSEVDSPLKSGDNEGDGNKLRLAVAHFLLVYCEGLRHKLVGYSLWEDCSDHLFRYYQDEIFILH